MRAMKRDLRNKFNALLFVTYLHSMCVFVDNTNATPAINHLLCHFVTKHRNLISHSIHAISLSLSLCAYAILWTLLALTFLYVQSQRAYAIWYTRNSIWRVYDALVRCIFLMFYLFYCCFRFKSSALEEIVRQLKWSPYQHIDAICPNFHAASTF